MSLAARLPVSRLRIVSLMLALLTAMAAAHGAGGTAAAATRTTVFYETFESGAIGSPWQVVTAGGGRVELTGSPVWAGTRALRLTSTTTTGSLAYVRRPVTASADVQALASVYVKTEGAAGQYGNLLQLDGSDGRGLAAVVRTSGTGAIRISYAGRTYATTARLPLGRWARVALRVVRGAAGGQIQVRVDGTLVHATATAGLGAGSVGRLNAGNNRPGRALTLVVDNVTANIPAPTPAPTFVFSGRGTDHGIGLSQYGAYGRALAGQSHQQILAHYYRNTTLGERSPTTPIRVRIVSAYSASTERPAQVVGRSGPFTVSGVTQTFPTDSAAKFAPDGEGGWTLEVVDSAGASLHSGPATAELLLAPASATSRFEVTFKASTYNLYRGALRLRGATSSVSATNEVALDDYLLSVVPAESPASWPAAALRAQAIAARSYAYVHRSSSGTFDVYDDQRSQVYLGVKAERATTSAAVSDTRGDVVLYQGAVANTLFHSTGGGATEHNENVYTSSTGTIMVSPVAYLRGSPDVAPDGRRYDAASPWASWRTGSFTMATLSTMLSRDSRTNVGTLSRLDLTRRGVSGRLISVTLVGSGGTKTVSGLVFKKIFNAQLPSGSPLRSTLFYLVEVPAA